MPAKVFIGTSGYSYDDWIGPFYPPGMKKTDFLEYYSSRFSMVELNFTYYRQPEPQLLSSMLASTEDDFLFAVKAHRSMTHQTAAYTKDAVSVYLRGVEPLAGSGRLAAVLLQFPYSFHYTVDNRRYLSRLCSELKDLPVAVEFRNLEWQRRSVYSELEERGISLTVVDCPKIERLPVPEAIITADPGYIRFHGRNAENWWSGTNETRYDYLYSNDELDGWLDKIADMAGNSGILLIAFNNHWRGQAVKNAVQLGGLLREKTALTIIGAT